MRTFFLVLFLSSRKGLNYGDATVIHFDTSRSKVSSAKQVCFLQEIEEIFEMASSDNFDAVHSDDVIPFRKAAFGNAAAKKAFVCISRCIKSQHFQVAERALGLFNNPSIFSFVHKHADFIFPIVVPVCH